MTAFQVVARLNWWSIWTNAVENGNFLLASAFELAVDVDPER